MSAEIISSDLQPLLGCPSPEACAFYQKFAAFAAERQDAADVKIASVVGRVLEEKEKLMESTPKKDRIDTVVLVTGDVATFGYFALDTITKHISGAKSMLSVKWSLFAFGEIAGALNIAVSVVTLFQAIRAFKNGLGEDGWRLLWDAITGILPGVALIIVSSTLKGIVAAALATPGVFPALFIISMLFVVIQLIKKETNLVKYQDIASQLDLDDWKSRLQNGNFALPEFFKIDTSRMPSDQLKQHVIDKMQVLQGDMGVEAAVRAYRVWLRTLQKDSDAAAQEIDSLKIEVKKWNRSLHVRSAQQGIYALGILVSLIALSPRVNHTALTAINDAGLALANGIALLMDYFWTFTRNTPSVVPMVELQNIKDLPNRQDLQGSPVPT